MTAVNDPAAAKAPSWRWILVITLCGAMLSLPFLAPMKLPPIPSFHAEVLAAALGLGAISCVLVLFRRDSIPLPSASWSLPLLCLIIMAQIIAMDIPSIQPALLGALYLLWATGIILVGARLRTALGLTRAAQYLAWFVMLGGLLSALAGYAQIFHSSTFAAWVAPSTSQIWGNLGQRNHFANYTALALCSCVLLWANGKLGLPTFALCAGLLAVMLPLSASRSVWLYALVLLLIAAVWFYREHSSQNRRLLWASLAIFPVMVVSSLLMAKLNLEGLSVLTSLERLQTATGDVRPIIWSVAAQMFMDSPLTGVGFGQFGWRFFEHNADLPVSVVGFTHNAHNLVLQIGAELGLVGILVLGMTLWLWVRALTRLAATPAAWWLVSVSSVLLVHAMLEYPLSYTYFLGLAALMLGLAQGAGLEFAPSRVLRGGLAVAVALSWFVLAQLFLDYRYLEAFLQSQGKQIHSVKPNIAPAKERLLRIRRQSLLAPLVELGMARSIALVPDQLAAKIRVNGHAMRNYPVDDVVYRHAILLAMDGQAAAAVQQWIRAKGVYPHAEPVARAVLQERASALDGGLSTLLEHAQASARSHH